MAYFKDHVVAALYDDFPHPVFLIDSAKRIEGANRAVGDLFGYSESELLGLPASVLYASDEEYQLCMSKRSTLDDQRASIDSAYRFRRKDGTIFTGQLRSTLVSEPDGASGGFIGVISDLSEMLVLSEERRRAMEMLDTALETISEGFAIFDRNERLILFNSAYRRLCGSAGSTLEKGMTAEEIMRRAYDGGN